MSYESIAALLADHPEMGKVAEYAKEHSRVVAQMQRDPNDEWTRGKLDAMGFAAPAILEAANAAAGTRDLGELRAAMQADIDAAPHQRGVDGIENIWYVEGIKDAMLRLDQFNRRSQT